MTSKEARDVMREQLVRLTREVQELAGDRWGVKSVIADCYGLSPSYVSKLLSDSPPNVTVETCERIGARVGLDLAYFLTPDAPFQHYLIPLTPFGLHLHRLEHQLAALDALQHTKRGSPGEAVRVVRDALSNLRLVALAKLLEATPLPRDYRDLEKPEYQEVLTLAGQVEADLHPLLHLLREEDRAPLFRDLIGQPIRSADGDTLEYS